MLPHLTSVGVKEESTRIFVDFYMTLVEFSSDRKDLWMSAMEQLRSIAEQAHKAFVLALFLEKVSSPSDHLRKKKNTNNLSFSSWSICQLQLILANAYSMIHAKNIVKPSQMKIYRIAH